MDQVHRTLQRLAAALEGIGAVEALPSNGMSQLDRSGPAGELLAAAEAASAAGFLDEADDMLLDAPVASGSPAQTLVIFALVRLNDGEFHDHGIPGLVIERLDFIDLPAPSAGADMTLESTPDGGLRPVSNRPHERVFANVSTEIQVLGPNYDDDDRAARVHARGFDATGLEVSDAVNLSYHQRLSRRLLWGFAQCAFSDQRAFGVMFQRDRDRSDPTRERAAMPDAVIAESNGQPCGSVVVFSLERSLFTEHTVQAPLLTRRLPDVVLTGEGIDVVLSTMGAEDRTGRVGRPGKTQIADAVERFWVSQ